MDYGRVQRTLFIILILNLIVAGLKAVFGLLAGSVSMVADAFHSTLDSASNIIGLVSTQIAKQPPDGRHPYGHGKFETFGTLLIGGILLVTAAWILYEGANRLLTSSAPSITLLTVAVLVATIGINIIITRYERRVGEDIGSQILIADSEHTKSDVLVSLSVLAGFGAVSLGFPAADPLIAFGIAAVIGRMGIRIIREAGDVLTDAVIVDCEDQITRIMHQIPGVRGYHKFRCRGKPGELFADIHIFVDPAITVGEGHEIAEEARVMILDDIEGMADIVVHVDPYTGKEEAGAL
ncbi:MAG: cation transporter [Methanoculleus sp. SDB]|nr:MAG: cation transporter [Methanoculleus sp. SDB]